MPQQVGDPLGILDVGLTTRHRLDVPSVDYQKGEVCLQQVVDGFPIDPGALHGHVSDLVVLQPVSQCQQPLGCSSKGLGVLPWPPHSPPKDPDNSPKIPQDFPYTSRRG